GHRQRAIGEDDIRLAVDQLHRGSVEAADISARPMRVNLNVGSLDPAQIAELLNKSCEPTLHLGLGLSKRRQYGYAPQVKLHGNNLEPPMSALGHSRPSHLAPACLFTSMHRAEFALPAPRKIAARLFAFRCYFLVDTLGCLYP